MVPQISHFEGFDGAIVVEVAPPSFSDVYALKAGFQSFLTV
jgi:hypothetical protein